MYNSGYAYTLPSDIPAIQIIASQNGDIGLSPVSRLPQGAEIIPCGDGFDPETVKVLCGGQFYYVFLSDLTEKAAILAAAY